jgi:hypothetical protein
MGRRCVGGGGSGGCGGEPIGEAVEAVTGCCCVITVDGSPGACHDASGSDGCGPYEGYSQEPCHGAIKPPDGCSATGVRSGVGGAAEVLVLLLALAALHGMRRRFAS